LFVGSPGDSVAALLAVFDLPLAIPAHQCLANAKAIAAGTRVVSVSFTVFSAAHGRVAACQLVLELVPGTDPHASSHFKASRSHSRPFRL
jgi:hypothetical protein